MIVLTCTWSERTETLIPPIPQPLPPLRMVKMDLPVEQFHSIINERGLHQSSMVWEQETPTLMPGSSFYGRNYPEKLSKSYLQVHREAQGSSLPTVEERADSVVSIRWLGNSGAWKLGLCPECMTSSPEVNFSAGLSSAIH